MNTKNSEKLEKLDIEYRSNDFIHQTASELRFTLIVLVVSIIVAFLLIDTAVKEAADGNVYSKAFTVISTARDVYDDHGSGLIDKSGSLNNYLVKVEDGIKSDYYFIDTYKQMDAGYVSKVYLTGNDKDKDKLDVLIAFDDCVDYFSFRSTSFYILYQIISVVIIVSAVNFVAYTYTRYKVRRRMREFEFVEEQNKQNPSLHLSLWQ